MRRLKNLLCIVISGLAPLVIMAQEEEVESTVKKMMEEFETGESLVNTEQMTEKLYQLASNPLDINTAGEEELEELYLLNSFQVKSLQDYIQTHGKLLSVYELQFVVGFDIELVKQLKPFITVNHNDYEKNSSNAYSFRKKLRYGKHRFLFRGQRTFQRPSGYRVNGKKESSPKYKGDIYKLYSKYSFSFDDEISVGLTMEKDPGEEFFKGSNRAGFDFYSSHLIFRPQNGLDVVIFGDYNVSFGQGLVLWNGFSLGKSPLSGGVMKHATGIKEYTSANEHNYFRGIAFEKNFDPLKITMFYSNKDIDANIVDVGENEERFFSSFQTTGYHRTEGEIENRNSVNEQIAGGGFLYTAGNLKVGLTIAHNWYDAIMTKNSKVYNKFGFSGSETTNGGINYRFLWNDFNFFGEAATRGMNGYALLNGVNCQISSDIIFSLLHRYYDKSYYAPYSSGFSENTSTTNETGIYAGLKIPLSPSLSVTSSVDAYKFPWLKYTADSPSVGYDFIFNMVYAIDDSNELSVRFKRKSKQENAGEENLNKLEFTRNSRFRLSYASKLSDCFRWANRLEVSDYHKGLDEEFGWLIYQELRYSGKTLPLTMYLRYAFFDTEGYYSRIYTYEHDVLYAFSIPMYYSKGYRTYINLRYNLDRVSLYFKLAQTEYFDKKEVGSGLNKIEGNTKTEANFQIIYKF